MPYLHAQQGTGAKQATTPIDSLRQQLETVRDKQRRAVIYLRLAWEERAANPVESVVAAQSALSLSQSLRNDSLTATAYRFLSVAYRNAGEYTKAGANAYKALHYDEKRGDSINIGHSLNTISGILRYQQEIAKSEQFARRALGLGERLGNKKLTAYALLNLSEAQNEQKLHDVGLLSAERALRIWEEIGSQNYVAVVKSVMAKAFFQMNKSEVAEKYLREALTTFESEGHLHDVAQTLNHLARFKLTTGSVEEGIANALRAYTTAHGINAQFHEQEAAQILADCYERQGNLKEALSFIKIQKTLHDSIYAESAARHTRLLTIEYETEKKEQQLKLLSNQERLNLIVRALLVAVIIIAIVLLVIIVVRYRKATGEIDVMQSRTEMLAAVNDEIRLAHLEAEERNRDMRLAQLEIQDQNFRLNDMNEEKNMILGMVSHDLKNPIVAVQGLSEMMLTEDFSTEQYKEFAQIINDTSNRMFNLVRTFLDFSRMEDGKVKLNPIEFDLNAVVQMMTEEYRRNAETKSITVHCTPYFEPLVVFADETAAKQVVDNLISNAVKYTPKGKNVAVRILPIQTLPQGLVLMREDIARLDDLELESVTTHIRVEVMDEGPGLTNEDKARLFGKFARLSAQPTGGEHSTGLGLAIARKLTELMNGRIWCDSEPGEGATFYLELPCSMKPTLVKNTTSRTKEFA